MRARAALVLLVAVSACGGRGDLTVPGGEGVDAGLAQARSAGGALYYAGRSFAGLPLTSVELQGPGRALFAYGTCVIPAGQREGGCAVPVQIQHFPFRSADWRRAVGCRRLPSLLGVPTVRHDGLVLFTGRAVVKVYARIPAEERRVAGALRRVRDDEPVERLPPPAPSVETLQARVCR